jgi:Ca2+-binding RTX toxin-like protein
VQANGLSSLSNLSGDGRYVVFQSQANNLVAGDSNGTSDVFRVSLQASDAGDWMVGSDGNDTIDGLGGSDILTSGAGSDTLTGGLDEDELQGGAGNDVLRGSEGGDIIDGGAGSDAAMYSESTVGVTISLAAGTGVGGNAQGDVLISIETVYGGLGNDTLVGSVGNDGLVGGAGNDVLRGLAGKDTLIGGAGSDRFFYAAPGDSPVGANADVIADFSHA